MGVFSRLSINGSGTIADWYVNGAVPSSGNGLTPETAFKTIQEGVDAASAGQSIAVYGYVYPESVALTVSGAEGSPITLTGVSGDVIIDGGDLTTGWTACTDQADAGGNANWASMYRTTIPSSVTTDPLCYNLRQGGVPFYMPVVGAAGAAGFDSYEDLFNPRNDRKYSGSTSHTSTTLTDTTGPLSSYSNDTDLDNAYVMLHQSTSNFSLVRKITAFNATTKQITFDVVSGVTLDGEYAILNEVSTIFGAGQWAFKQDTEVDGSRVVWCWPLDPEAMDDIRVTTRAYGLNVAAASDWIIQDIQAHGAGGTGLRDGLGMGTYTNNGDAKRRITFRRCRSAYQVNFRADASGGSGFSIEGSSSEDIQLIDCDTYRTQNVQGIYLNGINCEISGCIVDWPGGTGIRPHVCTDLLCYDNSVLNVFGSHANGMSFYLNTTRAVIAFNTVRSESGIGLTYQQSTNLLLLCNDVQCPLGDSAGHRGIENNATTSPTVHGGVISCLNNTCGPAPGADLEESGSGISIGRTGETTHNAVNNAAQGGCDYALVSHGTNAVKGDVSRNVLTGLGSGQSASGAYFTDQENSYRPTVADVFDDYADSDYLPVSGGPLDGTGSDISALLAPFRAWFPSFNFDRDIAGAVVDWTTNAFIGAYKPTVTLPFDRNAEPFAFAEASGVSVGQPLVEAAAVQITGLVGQVWAQVSGGTAGDKQIEILDTDGSTVIDSWRSGPALLANNQFLAVRGDASDSAEVTLTVIGEAGNTTGTFSITTAEAVYADIVALATADGWRSLFDVSNPAERTLSGLSVTSLSDALGNLPPAVQSAAYGQYAADEFGSLGGLTMTSSQRGLITGSAFTALTQPYFVMVVVRDDSSTQASRNIAKADNFQVFTRNVTSNFLSATTGTILQSTHAKDANPHIVEVLVNGASSQIMVDGSVVATGAMGAGTFDDPLSIGSDGGNNSRWEGAIGPVLIYAGDPGATKRNAMRDLLSTLTGIAV